MITIMKMTAIQGRPNDPDYTVTWFRLVKNKSFIKCNNEIIKSFVNIKDLNLAVCPPS